MFSNYGSKVAIEESMIGKTLKTLVCFCLPLETYHILQKYREGLREGEYQTLSKDLFIQKPLSIKDLTKEIHKRIGSK